MQKNGSFAVVYRFSVHPGKEQNFLTAWTKMTLLIKEHEGGLGSRLHRSSNGEYIAYALWPDEQSYKKAGSKLPTSALEIRQTMRESCASIHTEFELNIVEDLIG
ncbi:MAG: antibiotic biosynthesis monooxygenase [Bacteroidetes bacterium]|nr:MAG: antibiotic biosynthesis monooxygenase [Bacteroidota bacterium]